MDVALNSPVSVQRSPNLAFSPHSTPFTLLSPTISQPDTSILPPPANSNMSSSEPSSPITAPESPIMPEATSPSANTASPPSHPPPAAMATDFDLAQDSDIPSAQDQPVEAREQLAQARAQPQEIQEQYGEITARQTERLESLNSDSEEASGTQAATGLGIQVTTNEPGTASTSPHDTPSTESSTTPEQPTPPGSTGGTLPEPETGTAEVVDSTQPAIIEILADPPQPIGEQAAPAEPPVQPPPPGAPDETPLSSPPADATPEAAEWVDIEEDTSTPDEEELKEIEAANDISARDVKHHEDSFYAEAPEDPEQQPLQKMRLTWVIKGVRGTKEKPNRARIMNSPAIHVGGFYWYLKFFPRGNNSSALSAYVKCSKKEPKPDEEVPENTFSAVYGSPDADLGELEPAVDMAIPARAVTSKEEPKAGQEATDADEGSKKVGDAEVTRHDEAANASAGTEERSAAVEEQDDDAEDWRVSAQIGIIIYNPEEPRTKFDMAACHQFNKHNDDWGWTNFHGPWSEIHKRRPGQRQALLRNDTLALDAYVRVFNDPSQALWWHQCGGEEQWDSVTLTGFPAMGTKSYHSPGVAAVTSWLLLAPFRRIFQSLETDGYRQDSRLRPQSLCSQLQMILYLMRKQKKDEKFVSLEALLDIIEKIDESGTDVVTFWEGFRRSLEMELQNTPSAVVQMADIFDGSQDPDGKSVRAPPLRIPVENVGSVQAGVEQSLAHLSTKRRFPKLLTIEFERQKFDTEIREWKMSYDRVRLSEELDLSPWSTEAEKSRYTLFGFVVHLDERNSGKFYSILRPHGPGAKWLAFEDGTPNQVISYTKHRIQDFEGLEGDSLKENKATRQTAYLAMYIRTDLLQDFLPGALEPYELSPWLKNCPQVRDYLDSKDIQAYDEESKPDVKLEIYSSATAQDRHGLVDIQTLKDVPTMDSPGAPKHLTVPADTTYQGLRQKLAKWNGIDDVEKIKLWTLQLPSLGAPLSFSFKRVSKLYKTMWDRDWATSSLCIWMHVLEKDEQVKLFGDPEPAVENDAFDCTISDDRTSVSDVHEIAAPIAVMPADPDLPTGQSTSVVVEFAQERNRDAAGAAADAGAAAAEATAPVVEPADAEHSTISNGATAVVEDVRETTTAEATTSEGIQPEEAPLGSGADEPPAATATDEVVVEADSDLPDRPQEAAPGDNAAAASPDATLPNTTGMQLVTDFSAEDESAIAALIAEDLETFNGVEEGPPQPASAASTPAGEREESPNPTEALPAGSATEVAEASVPERPLDGAEDTTAAAPPPPAAETANDDAQSDSSEEDEVATIRPVSFYYGFIQLFDAQGQDFVVHGDFLAQSTENVKDFVRKQLDYADDKSFHVWRRGDAYHLTSVQASSTFDDIRDDSGYRHDGFVLVVGDVLSDSTKTSLTAISSFHSPEPLSRYLWFSARNHPVKAHTGHITISSFGLDYYAGHLLKGLYSGSGTHITPTGHSYTGPFLAGSRSTSTESAEGTCTYSNGDTYTGGWVHDEKHGQGTFVEKRTGNKYVGGYQEGKRWGKGTTYWEVADEEGEMCQICYSEGMDALFYDCGHVCACVECAKQVEVCPICRKTVKQVVKIWKA